MLAVVLSACESPLPPSACGPIAGRTLHAGESASVPVCFNDPDGDALSYAAVSSDRAAVTALAAGSIEARRIAADDTVTVDASAHFEDPDGEELAYAAASSELGVVSVGASGSEVEIAALLRGTASVEITATDPGGLEASQSFVVTVPNRGPAAGDMIPQVTLRAGEADTVDVSAFFADPDGDTPAFGATAAEPGVAAVVARGAVVEVTGLARGETGA